MRDSRVNQIGIKTEHSFLQDPNKSEKLVKDTIFSSYMANAIAQWQNLKKNLCGFAKKLRLMEAAWSKSEKDKYWF